MYQLSKNGIIKIIRAINTIERHNFIKDIVKPGPVFYSIKYSDLSETDKENLFETLKERAKYWRYENSSKEFALDTFWYFKKNRDLVDRKTLKIEFTKKDWFL
jgi:hypothetical protein